MARALPLAEKGDAQNIGCCLARLLSAHPKLECPPLLLTAMVDCFAGITDAALVSELQVLLAHWHDRNAVYAAVTSSTRATP